MKEFNATYNVNPRSNAVDSRTGEALAGIASVGIYLPQTGETMRYVSVETWEAVYTPEEAHAVIVGKTNNNAMRYSVTAEFDTPDNLRAALICRNGSQPVWYATDNGFCSPTYRNMKWHDRLETIAEAVEVGYITVDITTESGCHVDTVAMKWSNRDELGRFIAKDKSGKSKLLNIVDEAVKRYKKRNSR